MAFICVLPIRRYGAVYRPRQVSWRYFHAQPVGIAVWAYLTRGEKLPKSGWCWYDRRGCRCDLCPRTRTGAGRGGPDRYCRVGRSHPRGRGYGNRHHDRARPPVPDPVSVAASLQNAGGIPVALVATAINGDRLWDGTLELWGILVWSVIGLSAIGVSLVVWLSRHNGPTKMSALLLAVPPLSALEAYMLFNEQLISTQMAGFVVAIVGVFLMRVRANVLVTSLRRMRSMARKLDLV